MSVASLPLEAALSATVEQAEKKHIAHTLSAVRADVRSGMRLAEALAARPRDFPEIYRALIAAGEESGDLAQVMERLADYMRPDELQLAFNFPAATFRTATVRKPTSCRAPLPSPSPIAMPQRRTTSSLR